MNECNRKKRVDCAGTFGFVVFCCLTLFFFVGIVHADPPTPHNVQGQVFTSSGNGVQNGIPVTINNTDSNTFVTTQVFAPPIPQLRGIYSAVVSGSDGDTIIVRAYNGTSYGENTTTLLSSTTEMNIIINITRPPETNVTILDLVNDTVKNKSVEFAITANVSVLGHDGEGCNATLNITDTMIVNTSNGENYTKEIGDINAGNHSVVNWTLVGLSGGSVNMTVSSHCTNASVVLEGKPFDRVYNITIETVAGLSLSDVNVEDPLDLNAGGTRNISCNVTVTSGNSVNDISHVNATIYHESVGLDGADDNNNRYTNSSCTNVSSSDVSANYSCGFEVEYYADNGTWRCAIFVNDSVGDVTNISTTFTVNQLLSIDVSPSFIDYGDVVGGTVSEQFNITLQNLGNIDFDVTVRAYAPNESFGYQNNSMTCETGSVSNDNQRFATNPDLTFVNMLSLNNESISLAGLSLPQRTNDNEQGLDVNVTYWQLQAPGSAAGSCNGTIVLGVLLG